MGRHPRKSNATPYPGPLRTPGTSLFLISFHDSLRTSVFFLSVSILSMSLFSVFLVLIFFPVTSKLRSKSWSKLVCVEGIQQGSYQNTGSYQNYPQEQYIRPQGNTLSQQGEFNQPYSPRSHYSPYAPDVDRLEVDRERTVFKIVFKEVRKVERATAMTLQGISWWKHAAE